MCCANRAKRDPTLPVILVTAYGSVEEAVTAMKEGAFDFIQKPVDLDHLNLLLERAAQQQELLRENLLLREEYAARYGFPRIVGEHPAMKEASQMTQRVAATDSTVLLLGESGTGKELFARAIHHLSPRANQPFVALNCAAIPEGLVENELFGHERGAYTGAGARKIGKLELAHRGTLFLDEIGELPLAIQSKLLRVLEEKRFERVGGTQEIEVNVRILTATNKDLRAAVADKTFREDLLLPHRRRAHHDSAAARPRRRRAAARRTFSGALPARVPQAGTCNSPSSPRRACGPIPGRATCANCRTPSSAPRFWRAAQISTQSALQLPGASRRSKNCPTACSPSNFCGKARSRKCRSAPWHTWSASRSKTRCGNRKWNKTRAAEKLGVSYKTLLNKIRVLGLEN